MILFIVISNSGNDNMMFISLKFTEIFIVIYTFPIEFYILLAVLHSLDRAQY